MQAALWRKGRGLAHRKPCEPLGAYLQRCDPAPGSKSWHTKFLLLRRRLRAQVVQYVLAVMLNALLPAQVWRTFQRRWGAPAAARCWPRSLARWWMSSLEQTPTLITGSPAQSQRRFCAAPAWQAHAAFPAHMGWLFHRASLMCLLRHFLDSRKALCNGPYLAAMGTAA